METAKISDCCTDQFQRLSKYFHDITFSDLDWIDEDDIVQTAMPEDRLLMKVFVIKCIRPFFETLESKPVVNPRKQPRLSVENGVLNLQRMVLSPTFEKDTDTHLIPLADLPGKIQEDIWPHHVRVLDLSYNHLSNKTLEHISRCLDVLPQCEVLDLSYNSIRDDEGCNELERILNRPSLSFLKICVNAIASDLGKSFLHGLDDDALRKLIWIPKIWLSSSGWKGVMEDERKCVVVEQTHYLFYTQFPE